MNSKLRKEIFGHHSDDGSVLGFIIAFSAVDVELKYYNEWSKNKKINLAKLYEKLLNGELKSYALLQKKVAELIDKGAVEEALNLVELEDSKYCQVFDDFVLFENWANKYWGLIRDSGLHDNYDGWIKDGVGVFYLTLDV